MASTYCLVSTIRCVNTSTMLANTENVLLDTATTQNAILPVGAMVQDIWLHKNINLTDSVVLRVGVQDNNEYLMPASANVTTSDVEATDIQYYYAGAKPAIYDSLLITINPVDTNVSGQIEVYIRYITYSDLT